MTRTANAAAQFQMPTRRRPAPSQIAARKKMTNREGSLSGIPAAASASRNAAALRNRLCDPATKFQDGVEGGRNQGRLAPKKGPAKLFARSRLFLKSGACGAGRSKY